MIQKGKIILTSVSKKTEQIAFINLGGYCVIIDNKEINFDFNDMIGNAEINPDGSQTITFDLSNFDEDLVKDSCHEEGFPFKEITAQRLTSTSEFTEFYLVAPDVFDTEVAFVIDLFSLTDETGTFEFSKDVLVEAMNC